MRFIRSWILAVSLAIAAFTPQQSQAYPAPLCWLGTDGWYRCSTYILLPLITSPFDCNGSAAPVFNIPQTEFTFGTTGRTVIIHKGIARIVGVQKPGGGTLTIQINKNNPAYSQPLVAAADDGYGEQNGSGSHPLGLPFLYGDTLLVETWCRDYTADVAAGATGDVFGNTRLRLWGVGIEYKMSP